MNGKKSKMLRMMTGFIPSASRSYHERPVKTVMVNTGRMDASGKAIIIPEQRVQVVSTGERFQYQQIKKGYHLFLNAV